MKRYLTIGKHVLNLGGIPLTVPDSVASQYCGPAYLFLKTDTSKIIYLNNNLQLFIYMTVYFRYISSLFYFNK